MLNGWHLDHFIFGVLELKDNNMKDKIIDLIKYCLQVFVLMTLNYIIGFNNTIIIALAYLTHLLNKWTHNKI